MPIKPVSLARLDPARNMARYYALSIEPTLFGPVALVRAWGRIGTRGQAKSEWHSDHDAAAEALQHRLRSKIRRGYVARAGSGSATGD